MWPSMISTFVQETGFLTFSFFVCFGLVYSNQGNLKELGPH
jgi:hypothetical protein